MFYKWKWNCGKPKNNCVVPQLPYFCPQRISVIGLMRLFSLKKVKGKLCPPASLFLPPPLPKDFCDAFCVAGLDAPVIGTHTRTIKLVEYITSPATLLGGGRMKTTESPLFTYTAYAYKRFHCGQRVRQIGEIMQFIVPVYSFQCTRRTHTTTDTSDDKLRQVVV